VKPMLGLIISLGINKKVLATHLLVSWHQEKVWGYTQECVKEVRMLQHYKRYVDSLEHIEYVNIQKNIFPPPLQKSHLSSHLLRVRWGRGSAAASRSLAPP
jgi:hypothetical protein